MEYQFKGTAGVISSEPLLQRETCSNTDGPLKAFLIKNDIFMITPGYCRNQTLLQTEN